ncbi:MAG: alanine--tRNA ligase-related protein, partial [Spirochaetia bacterium]
MKEKTTDGTNGAAEKGTHNATESEIRGNIHSKTGDLLYYTEPYTCEFTAVVRTIERDKKGAAVQLDRTAFYPEGGGQPADHGTIGGVQVRDVKKVDGKILHYLAEPPERFEERIKEGAEVSCSIDWERRF